MTTGKYDLVLKPFLLSMERELHTNSYKGDRPAWLQMSAEKALLEIYYHAGKLQRAVHDGNGNLILEYASDVANLSMMLTDITGALGLFAQENPESHVPSAGDVEVLGRVMGAGYDSQNRTVMLEIGNGDFPFARKIETGTELIDRAHVTRLTADNEALRKRYLNDLDLFGKCQERENQLEAELTKARELLKKHAFYRSDSGNGRCAECEGSTVEGHDPNCELGNFIAHQSKLTKQRHDVKDQRIREIESILEQHGTMTGDTTEGDYENLSDELRELKGEQQ